MKKRPVLHIVWGCFSLLVFFVHYNLVFHEWPPQWMERREQRQQILQRIQSAGGWIALKRDCQALADKYRDGSASFVWAPGNNNLPPLPSAIAALKPKKVTFYTRQDLHRFDDEARKCFGTNEVVRISIFGALSTGGHDQPSFGLDVVCEPLTNQYNPERLRSTAPLRYWDYRKVANDIYEFY